jgi:hypothetical protein
MVFFRNARNDSHHQTHFYFNWDANNTEMIKIYHMAKHKIMFLGRSIKKTRHKIFTPHVWSWVAKYMLASVVRLHWLTYVWTLAPVGPWPVFNDGCANPIACSWSRVNNISLGNSYYPPNNEPMRTLTWSSTNMRVGHVGVQTDIIDVRWITLKQQCRPSFLSIWKMSEVVKWHTLVFLKWPANYASSFSKPCGHQLSLIGTHRAANISDWDS